MSTDIEGPVRIVSPNGDVYLGEIVSVEPHGQETRTYTNGNKNVGEWEHERDHGQGSGITFIFIQIESILSIQGGYKKKWGFYLEVV